MIWRRWVVERTFGWLMHHRRLAHDYETHPHRSAAMIKVAMVDLMSRRLTRESTPNWNTHSRRATLTRASSPLIARGQRSSMRRAASRQAPQASSRSGSHQWSDGDMPASWMPHSVLSKMPNA